MRANSGLVVLVACLVACARPLAPNGVLTGRWVGSGPAVPSGPTTVLVLRHSGSAVSGTAEYYGGPWSHPNDVGLVSGTYADSAVRLELRFRTAGTIQFVGALTGPDTLRGSSAPAGFEGASLYWRLRQ